MNEINPLLTRRDALGLFGAAASLASFPSLAQAPAAHTAAAPRPAFSAAHKTKPLGFDPAKLEGLSERLIRSHWENNYVGSVKSLNLIETRLAAAMREPDFPAVVYGGLKREELHRVGSVVLHEHYFDNLGGDGKPGGEVAKGLSQVYGSTAAWEAEFRRTAMSLAGGSGWCLLTFNAATGELRNQWAWDHMHGAVAGLPLLVLDMYEHSYHMDYGTAAAQYVDAFFANVDWEVVEERYQRARRFTA